MIFALVLRISILASVFFLLKSAQISHAQPLTDTPNPASAIKRGDLPEAARQARQLADEGDPEGQHMLALFHWHGIVLPQSFQDALNWVTLSAISGNRRAVNAREAMLKTVEHTISKKGMDWARAFLNKRAEAGDNTALLRLAVSFSPSFGFANAEESYFWYNLAVSSGNLSARKQRNELIGTLKSSDIIKTQERAKDWLGRWRKDNLQESSIVESTQHQSVVYGSQSDAAKEAIVSEAEHGGEGNASIK